MTIICGLQGVRMFVLELVTRVNGGYSQGTCSDDYEHAEERGTS